jgi:uncharacterized membrane protein YidH (DUF202 family)
MQFAMKKSHFFSFLVFGCAVVWFSAFQLTKAAAGGLAWSDIPAILVLAVLVSGLAAIAFNFAWLQMLERRGQSSEEPQDYFPNPRARLGLVMVIVAVSILGVIQGYSSGAIQQVTADPQAQLRSNR